MQVSPRVIDTPTIINSFITAEIDKNKTEVFFTITSSQTRTAKDANPSMDIIVMVTSVCL